MKERLRSLLIARRPAEIAGLAAAKRRVLGVLVSLTYDPDPLIAWRAVEAQAAAAERIADDDQDYVRAHLRRLHWLLSEESGAVCRYAPQSMAEIVSRRYDLFSDYAPIIATLLDTMADEDLVHFRPGIFWALARLGPRARGHIEPVIPRIVSSFDDPDPQTRGMSVWCLSQLGCRHFFATRDDLLSDHRTIHIYRDGNLDLTSIGVLAAARLYPHRS